VESLIKLQPMKLRNSLEADSGKLQRIAGSNIGIAGVWSCGRGGLREGEAELDLAALANKCHERKGRGY